MPNGKFERPPQIVPDKKREESLGERPEDKVLRVGDLVEVFRTSGEREGGWEIVGWEKGQAIVRKKEGDEVLEKRIPAIEVAVMNAPETTRICFKKEEFKRLRERWGGELPEDWDETIKDKKSLSVSEARGLFSQIPSSFEKQWKDFIKEKGTKAFNYEQAFDDFVHRNKIDVSRERFRAERLQAFFGREIPLQLLSEEERDKRIREATGT